MSPRRPSLPATLLAVLTAAVPIGSAVAQQPDDGIFAMLPRSTWAVATCAGLDACARTTEQVPLSREIDRVLGRLAESSGFDLRSELVHELLGELRREFPIDDLDPGLFRDLLRRPLALAVGRPTLAAGFPLPSVAFAVEVGDDRALGDELRGRLLEAVRGLVPETDRRIERIGEARLEVVRFGEAGTPPLCFARVGGWQVMSNSPPYLRQMLTPASERLATRPSLPQLRAPAAGEGPPLAELFLDTWQLRIAAPGYVPYEVDELCDLVGVRALSGMHAAVRAGEAGCRDSLAFLVPGSPDGLVRTLFGTPVSHGAARYCPPDTLLYATMHVDGQRVFATIERLLERFAAPAAREFEDGIEDAVEDLADALGLDEQTVREVLAAIGSELTIALPPFLDASGPIPMPVAMLELRREIDVFELVRRVFARMPDGPELRTVDVDGVRIGYFALPLPPPYVEAAFCVHDSTLIVGPSVRAALKPALRRGRGDAESLASQQDFRAMTASSAGAGHVVYTRIGRNIEPIWRTLQPWAMAAIRQVSDGDVDPLVLPDVDELEAALGDSLLTVGATGDAIRIEQRGPLGLGVCLAFAGGLLADVLDELARPQTRDR